MTDTLNSLAALLVFGLLNAVIVAVIQTTGRAHDARFLVRLYIATLLIRSLLATVLNAASDGSATAATFWGDSETYDFAGNVLARQWQGEAVSTPLTGAVSGYGFVYYVAAIYTVFGRNQLLVQLLNATIGSLTVLVVYAISNRLFGRAVARVSALFAAFFPQMIFWSAGMYKDPSVLLCIALSMLAVLRLREAFSPGKAMLLALAVTVLLSLRFYIAYFVALAALGTFAVDIRGSLGRRAASYALVLAALLGAFGVAVKPETLAVQRAYLTLDQMQVTRMDQAMWGKSGYGTGHDVSTPGGALRALPIGIAYLLFAPFPWAINGVRQLLVVPETLVWYALMPAFVKGLLYSLRYRLRDVLPIVVFATTLTIAYALMQGNVGTAYRQRTQVAIFFFVFMAVGITRKNQQSAVPEYSRSRCPPVESAQPSGASDAALLDHDFVFEESVQREERTG